MVMVEYFGEFAKIQFSREVADRRNSAKLEKTIQLAAPRRAHAMERIQGVQKTW
jgi:hypothetical protein